jgi:hypothetical protein
MNPKSYLMRFIKKKISERKKTQSTKEKQRK